MKVQHCLLAIAICSSSLFAQEDSPKSDDKRPTVPLLEFRKAWSEEGGDRVASDFKQNGKQLYLEPKAQITEADILSIKLEADDQLPDRDNLNLMLTDKGAQKMRTLTKEHLQQPLAILVKGKVVMAPIIREELSRGITFPSLQSKKESQDLVAEIQNQIDEPVVPLIEFRKAWYEKEEGRVASNFKHNDRELYLEPKAQITEHDIKSVKLVPSKYYEYDIISLELTEAGAKKMRTLSKEHLKKPLAILVRGKVVIAPTIQEQISNRIEVAGVESKREAQHLVAEIKKRINERD